MEPEWRLKKGSKFVDLFHIHEKKDHKENIPGFVICPDYLIFARLPHRKWKCMSCSKEAPDEIKVQWELLNTEQRFD